MKKTGIGYYDPSRWSHVPVHELMQAQGWQMPVEIVSYKQALEWWKKKINLWTQTNGDRPVGKVSDYNRRMRMRTDKTIVFDYCGHELAAWHPDNTLTVQPWSGYRNGAFDRFVMPRTVEVGSGARTGKVIHLRTADNLQKWDKITIESVNGVQYITNPDTLVVRAQDPVLLHRDENGRWMPVNEMKCKPFYWFELDKGRLREASKKYNMPEFLSAIETAIQMGADIKTQDKYGYAKDANEAGEDILELLEQGRYVEAASLIRASEDKTWDSVNNRYIVEKKGLNSGDVRAIRHKAYLEMGLVYLETDRIVTLPQFNNIERKLADFGPAE